MPKIHVNCQNNQNITCPVAAAAFVLLRKQFPVCSVALFCVASAFVFLCFILSLCTLPCDCSGFSSALKAFRRSTDDVQEEAEQPQTAEK